MAKTVTLPSAERLQQQEQVYNKFAIPYQRWWEAQSTPMRINAIRQLEAAGGPEAVAIVNSLLRGQGGEGTPSYGTAPSDQTLAGAVDQ